MAYSSVRVQFEIGHEASVRAKKTPEGFTHDWEVFVRGADNTDIQHFVDKVVFHLHETFPKPKRGIKQPPYVVKESGYAGFVLPIDVYLKNKEEPKKISFQYDLTLQSSGPPISRVLREPRLFQNPSEDFRRKLIRGGGVGVDTPSEQPAEDLKSAPAIPQNKSKSVETPVKKHKSDQPLNHSFAELFGTPIRRVPEQKKLPEPPKKVDDRKKSSKPYKDEKETSKDKYSEREKSKEKPKRPPSPLPPPPTAQFKSKDEHKKHEEKEKKKEDERKKRKDEKDKKEKVKEPDRQVEREHKKEKKESRDGDYAKKLNSKPPDVKPNYEKHNNEGADKEKEKLEKEKHKHRHKKKEKEKNREKEKHRKEKEKESREREREKPSKKKHEEAREKEEKRRKSRSPSPVQMKKGPLNALLDELGSSDSASPLSEDEAMPTVAVKSLPKPPAKPVPETKPQPSLGVAPKPKSTNSNEATPKLDDPSPNKNKKERSSSKKSKKSDKDPDKKKEKEEHRARSISSERAEREEEEEMERSNKEERQEKDRPEEDKPKPKDKENRKRKREKSEEKQGKPKKGEAGAVEAAEAAPEEVRRPDKFTKEYVAQLKDLQRRIMTLEDNAELQKVVKVIAETGQYEVTKKSFDFDLCALDLETVKRLQDCFAPT